MLFLLSILLCSVVYSQKQSSFTNLPALDRNHYINIGEKSIKEIECIKTLDSILKVQWTGELAKIPTTDLENLTVIPWEDVESTYTKYNTFEDEWLMEEGSPTEKISQCSKHLLPHVDIHGVVNQNDLNCLSELLSSNTLDEIQHQRDFEALINTSSMEQLPFRKFINFPEVVDLIFQNRQRTTWTSLEGLLYEHTKSYVLTNVDKMRRNYFASQNCDWRNVKNLREASSEVAKYKEFISQVRHSVNKHLAGRLVKNWDLNTILPIDRYELWLKSRQEMMSNLELEVESLRKQNRETQWLCEYASELANNFTDVQSSILLTEAELSVVHLQVFDVVSKTKTIEVALAKLKDARHSAIQQIAKKQEERARCLSSLLRFVQNHRRYELASLFIDEEYEYPEIYCENAIKNPGLIRFTFCNCIGSFCVSHYLAALFAEEYALVKGSDGLYKVVRSGIRSKRKVPHCHTLANSSKN